MPRTENDLKDLLAERADVPTQRDGRLDEVHRKIRRRDRAKLATTLVTVATTVVLVALAGPVVARQLGSGDAQGLDVADVPSATPSPPSARYTIEPQGSSLQVTVIGPGDLSALRQDLRDRGIPAVASPSAGYGRCADDEGYFSTKFATGAQVFVLDPSRFGPTRQLVLRPDDTAPPIPRGTKAEVRIAIELSISCKAG